MQILSSPSELASVLRRLMQSYEKYRWAVAWAGIGFDQYDSLLKHRDRIVQMVVGLHFNQTHPDFVEAFAPHGGVRFILQSDGVFHPKVYLFENRGGDWACIVGSPNFTRAAFSDNAELAVLIDSNSPTTAQHQQALRAFIDEQWKKGKVPSKPEIDRYRDLWERSREPLRRLSGLDYGNTTAKKAPVEVEILRPEWKQFVDRVRREESHPLEMRLKVLAGVRRFFEERKSLASMSSQDRKRVAGFARPDGVDWGYFGSMRGKGIFMKAVNDNDKNLSAALDLIPADGLVTRQHFNGFVHNFQRAFPSGSFLPQRPACSV